MSKIVAWNLDFDPGGALNPQGPGSGTRRDIYGFRITGNYRYLLCIGTRSLKWAEPGRAGIPVDTGVVVGVLVDLGPLAAAFLPYDDPLVVRAGGQNISEPGQNRDRYQADHQIILPVQELTINVLSYWSWGHMFAI